MSISQVNVIGAGFSASGIPVPLSLAAGQSASLSVVFAPAAVGSVTGSVSVVSNASNSPTTIALSGSGVAPPGQLSASPASLSLANVPVGSASTQTAILTNTGSGSVNISQVSVTGVGFSASGFSVPMSLSAGQSTALTVTFAPAAVGSVTGSVSIVSDAGNSPTLIALSGSAIAATLQLSANTMSLSFGNVTTGSTSSQTVVLTNTGNSSVSISQVNVTGAGFSASGISVPLTLAAGQSASLSVVFAPAAVGSVTGSVSVVSNASNSPATISLSGSGVQTVTHSVSLAWTASASVVVGYYVYRGTVAGGPYTKLNSTPVAATSYVDSTVQSAQTYYYVTTAVDSSGAESVFSNETSAAIP